MMDKHKCHECPPSGLTYASGCVQLLGVQLLEIFQVLLLTLEKRVRLHPLEGETLEVFTSHSDISDIHGGTD